MKIVEMLMPPMGESIMECTILHLLKNVGEKVSPDDSILEVATDKVDTEVPCPYEGTIAEWLVKQDDIVPIGSAVARIEVSEDIDTHTHFEQKNTAVENITVESPVEILEKDFQKVVERNSETIPQNANDSAQFYSPLVLSIAKEEKIGAAELAAITGTGAENRITKTDILKYLDSRKAVNKAVSEPVRSVSLNGSNEIIEMDRMRKMISQRMTESKNISAHVTSFIETDMTTVVKWREAVKNDYRKRSGDSITFTPILIEAVVKAIKDYPMINISVEGDKIVVKKDINIGMAVALPDGN